MPHTFRHWFSLLSFFRCNKDYIEVYDGVNKTERIALICGNRSVQSIRSRTNYLSVYFHSGPNLNMKGFAATYEYVTIDIAGRYKTHHYSAMTNFRGSQFSWIVHFSWALVDVIYGKF